MAIITDPDDLTQGVEVTITPETKKNNTEYFR
jgi:hypothetical protein